MNGARAVFQCKRYAGTAGTAAVQEAYSAKAFYTAAFGAVIAPHGFTRGAEALSRKTGVHLFAPGGLGRAHIVMGVPGEHRVIRLCTNCRQKLRLPVGRWARVKCPRCGYRFIAVTWWG
jgi:DNA-directed RNA polymerase subunit RPC12/RpoP